MPWITHLLLVIWSFIGLVTAQTADVNTSNIGCVGVNAISPQCKSSEVLHTRDFFYVGGNYQMAPLGTLVVDQLYVEKLTPNNGARKPYPLVFFHGGGPSGETWLNTPDNRQGFASYFLSRGYVVYIVDQTSVGRGSDQDFNGYPLRIGSTVEINEEGFTYPEGTNAYPQSQLHTQWPGTGRRGDPIFDVFTATFIPLTSSNTRQELSMRTVGCLLLSKIGKAFLVSHSIGAIHPILLSNDCPALVVGSVNLEPGNVPFQSYVGNASSPVGRSAARPYGLTVTQLTYDPPVSSASDLKTYTDGVDTPAKRSCILQQKPARKLPQIAKVPYVALTGEASPHATYDQCVIQFLTQAGVKADWIKLADKGIRGNGHFGYLEKNNLDIARVVEGWIEQHTGK